jgi:peptidyl-prolyl cis-trans isomerase SurA
LSPEEPVPLRKLVAAIVVSSLLSIATVGRSAAEVIERVVAVVNDDAIFLSELRQKAAPFLARAMQAPTEAQRMAAVHQIYSQLLERMIDERLVLQVADEEHIRVSSSEVDQAIANVRQQSQLDEREFWEAVRAQGFTETQYRRELRNQLLRLKVLNQRVRGRVNITEEDVRRRYQEQVARARRSSTFEAAYVRVPLPPAATATELRDRMRRAERIRAQLAGLETLEERIAAILGQGGSRTGRISQTDLAPEIGEALAQVGVGDLAGPVRTEDAIFVLLLLDRDRGDADIPDYDQIRMDLYREMVQEAMTRQEEIFLEELRRRAVIVRRLEL